MRIRTKRLVATFAGLIVLGVMAHTAVSQDKDTKGAPASAAAGGHDAAAMAAMMKAGTPGKEHQLLAKCAGTFDAEVIVSMGPDPDGDQPEMKSKGKDVSEMILGGRYLKSDFSGNMMGMPYSGTGLHGYDNTKQKYVSVWADSMSTAVTVSEGTIDESGRIITYNGEYACPIEGGKIKKFRQVLTIKDADHHEFEMFQPGPGGKEFRGLYIKYTRAK